MSEHANSIVRLDRHLEAFRLRLRRLHLMRALAAVAAAVLLLTVVGVYFAVQRGFAPAIVQGTRVALLLSVTMLLLWLLVRPWRRLARALPADIEQRTPEFGGRIETYAGLAGSGNPLRELLAEETLQLADRHNAETQIRRRMIALPAAIAVVAAAILLWLAVAGPGLYGYGVRHLYAGWAMKNLLPEQGILVTPGNQAVRRGGSVPVLATVHGFNPASAAIHVRVGEGAWQQVEMTPSARGFEFTLLSVREPVQYFVDAAGVRSASYRVDVVEVPNVENIRLVYDYPSWTRRKDETHDPGGDVTAVAGTEVRLEVKTDRPLGAGALVLNGRDSALAASGTTARGDFKVTEDGRYHLAARVGNETVRLTDDYLIKVVPDNKPEVKIARPGRDRSASNIEEVAARVQASDDFALENVELRYAVNGGAWQSVPLRANGADHVEINHTLMLENMQAGSEQRPLAAGDLVAYYAAARDRSQSAQTDLYFVEIRPFDRRYTQSQSAGGGGGSGGDEQSEISQRQKQILVSTWNLIRQKSDPQQSRAAEVRDNSVLLSDVQEKLALQTRSLLQRAEARALGDEDPLIKSFVDLMQQAAKAMDPAAQRLAAVDLEQAIQPEQLALQYLLRAEAVFTDLQVGQSAGGGGGGGQQQRDLAQLYELEMDLQKNQYEAANSASPDAAAAELDELGRRLQELARRQEQLANEARRQQQLSDEQRWQQESLRREAEQLRQQLQAANSQQGQPGQQGQQGQQGQSGSAGQASRQLEQAISAMNRASEAMRDGGDASEQRDQLQRAAQEAQRQLSGASQQLSRQRQDAIRSQLEDLSQRAEQIHAAQAAAEQRLQESASAAARPGTRRDSSAGLSAAQRQQLAGQKRQLGADIQRLEQDLSESARRLRADAPQTADSMQQAGQLLSQNAIQNQLAQAARYIESGQAAYVVARESGITGTLREVRDELRAAQGRPDQGAQRGNQQLQEALARVQSLRQQLQQLANANATGQRPGNQQGQQGQQQGAQQGQAGGNEGDGYGEVNRALNNAARQLGGYGSVLRGRGVSERSIEEVRSLAQQLQSANLDGRGDQLNRQLAGSLTLLEQLELRLSQGVRGGERSGPVRTAVTEPVRDDYRDAVAEYFRQLSRD